MPETQMEFEITMRLLFGERASHIADEHSCGISRTRWLQKALKKLNKEVDAIDTTVRHRQMMMGEIQALSSLIKPSIQPSWSVIYGLLRLVLRLLGYDYVRGARCHTVEYWQSAPQHHNSVVFEGGDIMQDFYDKRNAISLRRTAALALRTAGHSEHMIALALNTTEYELRKLNQ